MKQPVCYAILVIVLTTSLFITTTASNALQEGRPEPLNFDTTDDMVESSRRATHHSRRRLNGIWPHKLPKPGCPIKFDAPSASFGSAVGTIDVRTVKQKLLALVPPCSLALETRSDVRTFCTGCDRPLQDLIAVELNTADIAKSEFDKWDISDPALVSLCTEEIYSLLQEAGTPLDGAWEASLLGCSLKQFAPKTSECPISMTELLAEPAVNEAVTACLNPDIGTRLVYPDLAEEFEPDDAQKGEFCTACYWPYLKAMTFATVSEKFWCTLQSERDYSADGLTEEENQAYILREKPYQACLADLERYIESNALQEAQVEGALSSTPIPYKLDFSGAKAKMGDFCTQDQYLPEKPWLEDPVILKLLRDVCKN